MRNTFRFQIFPYFKLYLCNSFPRWAAFCLGTGVHVQFPRAAVTKFHLLGGLKKHNSFPQFWSIDVETTRSSGLGLTKGLFLSTLPAPGGAGRPWPPCSQMPLLCVRLSAHTWCGLPCVLPGPLCRTPAVSLRARPHPVRPCLQGAHSKRGHVPVFQGLSLHHNLFRGHSSPR